MIAIVTSGTSSIGMATARRLKVAGAEVAIAARHSGEDVSADLGATWFECDVSDEEQVAALMEGAVGAFGGLDIIVSSAGANTPHHPLTESRREGFDLGYSVNALGVAPCIKHGTGQTDNGERIVNISSIGDITGVARMTPYVASKWAIVGITKIAAIELAHAGSG